MYTGVDTAFTEWLHSLKDAEPFKHSAIREAFEAGFKAGQFDSRRLAEQARQQGGYQMRDPYSHR